LLASSWSQQAVILRLAGIYGPGRLPRLGELSAEQPLRCDPEGVINLIHVEDAADVVLRVAEAALSLPRTYVVADGHPVTRRAFYEELAACMRLKSPRFAPPESDGEARGRADGSKRVANGRLLRELMPALLYPSYREGLADLAARC